MEGTIRANIKPGMLVLIVLKKDQRTGTLTEGIVKDLLTSVPKHHRGIKVRLQDGQIGRVQEIVEEDDYPISKDVCIIQVDWSATNNGVEACFAVTVAGSVIKKAINFIDGFGSPRAQIILWRNPVTR